MRLYQRLVTNFAKEGNLKPLSDIHEFANNMQRVSPSYNSPHIATYVHELCHKRFGQNCSKSSIRHVHDIHVKISVDSCNPVPINKILVRVLQYVYENRTTFLQHVYEFLRVCKELCTMTRESLGFSMIYYDMLQHLYEISLTTYESLSTFHGITRFLYDF